MSRDFRSDTHDAHHAVLEDHRDQRVHAAFAAALGERGDLRVDDAPAPIAELRRLYADVHQYYFGDTTELVKVDAALVKELQSSLALLGFYKGPASGRYDAATRLALEDWMGWENLEGRIKPGEVVDALVLRHLRRQVGERGKK